jgi:alpha-glucosidase (family GH31 glycosyl hydrolase)
MRNNQSAPVWSKVWPPQPVLFPDFSAPATPAWWQDNIQEWFAMGVRADGTSLPFNQALFFKSYFSKRLFIKLF